MREFVSQIPIDKGWSGDKKYCVTDKNGIKYLLRITPKEKSASRADMYRMQCEVAKLDIPMCVPVEFGECEEEIYILQSFIDGVDLENAIGDFSEKEQYAYGLEAGRILKKIHTIPAPEDQPAWEPRFHAKMDRKIKTYTDCPLKYENGQCFIDFIHANRHLLKDRPQCYQHGDYHIGNMMLGVDQKLYIIDFDRYDFGDPWEEFNRIVWCAQSAPAFASGMVDGYFDGCVPEEFWRLLALYIASNTLSSLPWAIPFGKKEIDTMTNQAKEVLEWYDNMQRFIPKWYMPLG